LNQNDVIEADELPKRWTRTKVGEITIINYGKGLKEADRAGGIVAVYGSNGIIGYHNKPLTKGPAIIIGRKGSIGEVHFSSDPCWAIDTTYYIDKFDGINPKFLIFALKNLKLFDLDTSTAIPGLNRNDIYDQCIPLPPLTEQYRIVARVEAFLSQINAARDRLNRVPVIMKRFRQAVLAAACSGRLTEGWREENNTSLISEKIKDNHEMPECFNDSFFQLPENWHFNSLSDLTNSIQYGYTASANAEPIGPKMLRITDIQDGNVNWNTVPYCECSKENIKKYLLAENDILFARTGATTGKSFLIKTCPQSIFASYLIRVRTKTEISSKFLYLFFQSGFYWTQIFDNTSGTAQPNCNASKLASLILPVPPLSEQHEIVRYVNTLFTLADQIEHQVADATNRTEALAQAMLAKAFRGELAETDAELSGGNWHEDC